MIHRRRTFKAASRIGLEFLVLRNRVCRDVGGSVAIFLGKAEIFEADGEIGDLLEAETLEDDASGLHALAEPEHRAKRFVARSMRRRPLAGSAHAIRRRRGLQGRREDRAAGA